MDHLLQTCLQTARDAGVPRDQAERLVSHGYIPYPWQWRFHAAAREADEQGGPVDIGLGGARGPGKSHAVLSQAALDDCQRIQNLKGLFLRQTGVAAKESFDDLVTKVVAGRVPYERANNTLRFPNTNSRIILGGFKDENDIDKYIGIEYDFIIIEELNQLTEEKYQKLRGSLRTSKPNWRPRMYTSFNPGGLGHGFVKQRYVIPKRMMEERETRFIPSTYKQNPNLNTEYIEYLESLTGDLGKAWREGDFDLFAGQYFSEWRYDIHVREPFAIPDDWRRFCALDYGYNAPSALGWFAIDPTGQLYLYRELYQNELTYTQLAEAYASMTGVHENIEYLVADPAFWAKKGERDDALSGAEVFERRVRELTLNLTTKKHRCPLLQRGINDRVTGWREVREYLRPYQFEEELTAKLQVFSTCTEFIRTFPSLIHDEHNPEDVDSDGEDHAGDMLRYAVMSRPKPSKTADERAEYHFNKRMKEKAKKRERGPLFVTNR